MSEPYYKFELTEEQTKKFLVWRDELPKKYKKNLIEFSFMGTGIGEVVVARVIDFGKDHKILKEINLTEYDKW